MYSRDYRYVRDKGIPTLVASALEFLMSWKPQEIKYVRLEFLGYKIPKLCLSTDKNSAFGNISKEPLRDWDFLWEL